MDAQNARDSRYEGASSADATARYPEFARLEAGSAHKRRRQRARVFMTGVLMADGKFPDVWVQDLSETGARVRVRGTVPDGSEFGFRVNGVGRFRALLCWRDGNTLGIRFLEEPETVMRKLDDRLRSILAQ